MSGLHRLLLRGPHTCPWWFAYTFDNPLRRLIHDPAKILTGLVSRGDTVMDVGCGLGYFTLGLAELVGSEGRVISVDIQSEMLRRTERRAARRGLADRITFRQCTESSLEVTEPVDFVLAFWMVHEVSQRRRFLADIGSLLRNSGHLLIAEPKGHVSESSFNKTVELVRDVGFDVSEGPTVRFSRSVVCTPRASPVS